MYSPYAKVIYPKRRGNVRTRYVNPIAASRAKAMVRRARSTNRAQPDIESKYFDSFVSVTAVPESTDWTATEVDPAANSLFTPVEGSDIDTRVGRKVTVYKMSIRGVIVPAALTDQADILEVPAVRLILFQDMQTNGAQAQGEQVMAAPGAATAVLTFSTFQNTANFGRFRVLRDKFFPMGIVTAGTDGANTTSQCLQSIPFHFTVRFRGGMPVRFNGTNGGTVADIVDNSFHLLAQKSGTPFAHTISYQCRTYYKD